MYTISSMPDNTLAQIDAIIFRLIGCAIGVGGTAGLIINNPLHYLLTNAYGITFLAIFVPIGFSSVKSLFKQLVKTLDKRYP
ncbi:MAG TPA: hypothetical protein QF720_03910 [Nitrospinota bacterium]|jgi:hypothetical protein|nr:hypothetical protein [Nitrospinota bacterium]|tara:strand:+ start:28617 stop:28862 length:246 start_codon:yes stop_codon:yes gene_type:complete